jgi:hypothetical protein
LVQGEQRNKWQGPAAGGKDAVYAGCELEPTQWSATGGEVLIGSFSIEFFFLFSLVLQLNFLASTNVCCPERELLVALGLSFYPLEQAPNIMIYPMSKSGGQQRAVSSKLRVCSPKPRARRAPLLPKNSSARLAVQNWK